MKRWQRWSLIALAVVAVLIVAFYVEENWRGARRWTETKAKYEAQGFSFDPKSLIPPPIPDDQNFAKSEIWQKMENYKDDTGKEIHKIALFEANKNTLSKHESKHSWIRGQLLPPIPPQAFDACQTELDLVYTAAAERSLCRFDVAYDVSPPSALRLNAARGVHELSYALKCHALLMLEQGKPAEAFRDIDIAVRLINALGEQPSLISGVMSAGCTSRLLPCLWTGLENHRWTETELSGLQHALGKVDLIRVSERCLQHELTFMILPMIDWLRKDPNVASTLPQVSSSAKIPFRISIYQLTPKGWYDLTKSKATRFVLDQSLPSINAAQHRFYPEKIPNTEKFVLNLSRSPSDLMLGLTLPALDSPGRIFAELQSRIDLCRVALGLERYRLANQKYPATLAKLAPRYIDAVPHDLVTGEPLKYSLQPDGDYLLYSVGFNGTDEGGAVFLKKGSQTSIDSKQGDWVWPRAGKVKIKKS